MSSQRSRSSTGSLKRSSIELHNEDDDDDDNEAEQEEEGRSDSKRRRYTQPPERDSGDDDERNGHSAPHRTFHQNTHSHSQPAPNASAQPAAAADNGDDEIEFSYEGDESATQASQQQPVSRSQSSSQQSAAVDAAAHLADVELPEANRQWLEGYDVMRGESSRPGQPLDQQDRQHRTQIRQMYGEMTQQSTTLTPDQLQDPDVLVRGVAMANTIHQKVCHVTEEIQDAEALKVLAGKGHDKAKLFLQHDDIVNVEQMIAAIHEKFDNTDAKEDSGAVDWVRMGERTLPLSINAPVTSFMRGVLNQHIAHKERKRSQRRQRDEDLVSSTATTLDSSEQLVDKQTHMRQLHVLRHFKRLTRNGSRAVWLYELLIDPNSFVRTVENFFDFSFLVKDNVRMEWMEWDVEMAFPMVRWRRSELERTRERKRMERRLKRLKQRVAERQEAGDEDETAADAESRDREDRQCQHLVSLLRSLNQLPPTQLRLTQSQAETAAAEQRRQAATDESEVNVCHFTPTLDYHAWSSIVIKFGLAEAKIPPMTDEEERRLRERMDRRAKRKKGKEKEAEDEQDEENEAEEKDGRDVEEEAEEKEDNIDDE